MSKTNVRSGTLRDHKSVLELWHRRKWKLTFMYVAVCVVALLKHLRRVVEASGLQGDTLNPVVKIKHGRSAMSTRAIKAVV
jgi:hypothetical protein